MIYVRVSSVRGREGEDFHSPDLQEQACRRLADAQGLDVVEVLVDLDRTGRTFERDGMRRAMELAAARSIDAVVFYDLSRFGRNTSESLRHIRELRDAGVAVLSTVEKIDDTPEGQLSLTLFLGMAQLYSDQVSRRWSDVVRHIREAGGWHGHPPLGYRKSGRRAIEPDPATASVITEVFERYARGQTIGEVTELIRDQTGRPGYYRSSTRRLLRNVAYVGLVQHEGQVMPGRHEPIVDRATWDRVQERLTAASWTPPKLLEPRHPFARLLVCDSCGGPMTRHGSARRARGELIHHYRCRLTLEGRCVGAGAPADDLLTEVVLARVAEHVAGLRAEVSRRAEATARASRAKADRRRLARELDEIRKARGRLTVDYARRDITAGDYREAIASLDADEARLAALLEVESRAAEAGPRQSQDAAQGMLARWPAATMGERNRMLRAVVREVRVRPPSRPREPLEGRVEVVFL